MARTSKELADLNKQTAAQKETARYKKFSTYKDRGTSGREAGVREAIGRGNEIYEAYDRSKDMIERYGKDAPNARSFMAYEGQSGTVKKKAAGGKLKMVEKGGKKVPTFAADGVGKMAKGGKISEYSGKEMYKSKSAMMKHEGSESMAMERKERKMAMGGKCRGMGAATKGGNYKG